MLFAQIVLQIHLQIHSEFAKLLLSTPLAQQRTMNEIFNLASGLVISIPARPDTTSKGIKNKTKLS